MKTEALVLWDRAIRTLNTASVHTIDDPDSAASRAYYAVFHAVSALFALQGKTFTKHTALEAAVHRDLVRSGMWSTDLGATFSWLANLRYTGDYGGAVHVSPDEAQEAVAKARHIIKAVYETSQGGVPEPPA